MTDEEMKAQQRLLEKALSEACIEIRDLKDRNEFLLLTVNKLIEDGYSKEFWEYLDRESKDE